MKTPGNGSAAQRARIRSWLRKHRRLTTLEARSRLDVLHPAARIQELRKEGLNIVTHWRTDTTPEGRPHRVAQYVLMGLTRKSPARHAGRKNDETVNTGGRADG